MLRNRKRLSKGYDDEDSPDPMSSLANLSDIMLVFACGLMVALIMALKLDPARLDQAVVEYQDDTSSAAVIQSDGAGMEEVGTVYKDPKTGITYITKE